MDNPVKSNVWEVREIKLPPIYEKLDNNRRAKWFKMHPHKLFPDYGYSLWIDGSVEIKGNVDELVDEAFKKGGFWAVHPHASRKCIVEEAWACNALKKEEPEIMARQLARYIATEKYPINNGLAENTIILRRHNDPDCIKLNEMWWNEVLTWSKRDQLSFNYCVWKLGLNYNLLKGTVYDSKYFKINSHTN